MMTAPHLTMRQRGFSLVELMVSVVIGMLALMFALRLVSSSEKAGRAEIGGSDSMQTGMVALFTMSGEAAQSGYGLNDPILTGCDTLFSDSGGYTMAPALRNGLNVHPLAPVIIESNGQNPDRITFYAGGSSGGTPSMRLTQAYNNGDGQLVVDNVVFGFNIGDVVVVAPEQQGLQCALGQVSDDPAGHPALPASQYLQVASGNGLRFNNGKLGTNFIANGARVFNLGPGGKLAFHSWSVQDGFLQLSSTDVGGGATPVSVADNIVSVKAEYGFDTRTGANFLPASGMLVNRWSTSMIDADGDGVVGGQGDYGRIASLRLAVVARSKAVDAPGNAGCTATTSLPQVFATDTSGGGQIQVPLTVNVAVPGDSNDWRCYHYRVFETIVPLRNFAWRPS